MIEFFFYELHHYVNENMPSCIKKMPMTLKFQKI